jgi:hypothetical protein
MLTLADDLLKHKGSAAPSTAALPVDEAAEEAAEAAVEADSLGEKDRLLLRQQFVRHLNEVVVGLVDYAHSRCSRLLQLRSEVCSARQPQPPPPALTCRHAAKGARRAAAVAAARVLRRHAALHGGL